MFASCRRILKLLKQLPLLVRLGQHLCDPLHIPWTLQVAHLSDKLRCDTPSPQQLLQL